MDDLESWIEEPAPWFVIIVTPPLVGAAVTWTVATVGVAATRWLIDHLPI